MRRQSTVVMPRRRLTMRRKPFWQPWHSDKCVLWVQGDKGVTLSGGRVGTWVNRASELHPLGADVGNEPGLSPAFRNGHDVVDFDDTVPEFLYAVDHADFHFANGENFTLWLVVTTLEATAPPAIQSLLIKSKGTATLIGSAGAEGFSVAYRGDGTLKTEISAKDSLGVLRTASIADDIATTTTPHIITATFDWSGNIQPYLDGVPKTAKDISTGFDGDLAGDGDLILATDNGINRNTYPFKGSFADVGLIRKKQTASELNRIGQHLAWRYNRSWTKVA